MRSNGMKESHTQASYSSRRATGSVGQGSAGNGAKSALNAAIKDLGAGQQQRRRTASVVAATALLGSLKLPAHSVMALGKEALSVLRLLIAADCPDRPDDDYAHIAAFVSHALQQEQLVLRAIAADNAAYLGPESEDGVFAGAFATLLGYILRVVGGLTPSSRSRATATPTTAAAVSACLLCLVSMIERACNHTAKQPATTPADPATVPHVLLALERQRVPLLNAVYSLSTVLSPRGASNRGAEEQGVADTALVALGRLVALPWMTLLALPRAGATEPAQWVLMLRSRPTGAGAASATSSSSSSSMARRRATLPCLDTCTGDAAGSDTPSHPSQQRHAGAALRTLLEAAAQHLVDELKVPWGTKCPPGLPPPHHRTTEIN